MERTEAFLVDRIFINVYEESSDKELKVLREVKVIEYFYKYYYDFALCELNPESITWVLVMDVSNREVFMVKDKDITYMNLSNDNFRCYVMRNREDVWESDYVKLGILERIKKWVVYFYNL